MTKETRRPQILGLMLMATLILLIYAGLVSAGQVVTSDLKTWARQTVAQEKELQMVTKPQTVAVLYFTNPTNDPALIPLQKGLAVMLITDLAQLDMLTVIERTELQALVEELGLGQSGLVDTTSAPRVGRLLQTEFLIGGRVVQTDSGQLDVSATVLEVGPAKIISHARALGKLEQIFDLEKQILNSIVTALSLELTTNQRQSLAKPFSADPQAALELFQGIDAGDRQSFDAASGYYLAALNVDPQLDLARQSLTELTTLKLVSSDATAPPAPMQVSDTRKKRLLRTIRRKTSMTTGLTPSLPETRIPAPVMEDLPTN